MQFICKLQVVRHRVQLKSYASYEFTANPHIAYRICLKLLEFDLICNTGNLERKNQQKKKFKSNNLIKKFVFLTIVFGLLS